MNGLSTAGFAASFVGGTVEVVATPLDVSAATVHRLSLRLSHDEHLKAGRFAFERSWRQFVVARGRLRELLAERLDAAPEEIRFDYGERGKPALAASDTGRALDFNVAHSGELAVYAFSTRGEVGVDVEAMRVLPDADAIAARFFSIAEREAYAALEPRHRACGFFNCWTRKEAYIKALGDGLYHPLDGFDVTLVPDEPARITRVGMAPGEGCGWRLESFVPAPGYVGAVAFAEERAPRQATAVASDRERL